jgi:2-C-methyl-D-erythritol 2,4-cyclodiphosphate synthase
VEIRHGLGFDAHPFSGGRRLVLGGVEIPDSAGLSGHSDADVLSHAIADALLSAARLGDLGSIFPNDERWRDASSLDILAETRRSLVDGGWAIVTVDATVIAQTPRLASFRDRMIERIAEALDIQPTDVWVKATTTDGMGFTGRNEGIAALALVTIQSVAVE